MQHFTDSLPVWSLWIHGRVIMGNGNKKRLYLQGFEARKIQPLSLYVESY